MPDTPNVWSQAMANRIVLDECKKAGIDLARLKLDVRYSHYVNTRRRIATRLHTGLGMSWSAIGRTLDRDHTSVRYLVKGRARQ